MAVLNIGHFAVDLSLDGDGRLEIAVSSTDGAQIEHYNCAELYNPKTERIEIVCTTEELRKRRTF